MSKQTKKLTQRAFSLSNVNGLFLVAGVLSATILMAGVSDAKYQQLANEISNSTEFKVNKEMKLANCPLGSYISNSVVR